MPEQVNYFSKTRIADTELTDPAPNQLLHSVRCAKWVQMSQMKKTVLKVAVENLMQTFGRKIKRYMKGKDLLTYLDLFRVKLIVLIPNPDSTKKNSELCLCQLPGVLIFDINHKGLFTNYIYQICDPPT